MSALFHRSNASTIVEFAEHSVHIANDARSVELPVERDAAGSIAPASLDSIRNALVSFATRPNQREQVFCLLPARGVSPFQHIGILSLEFHVDKLSRPLL